MKSDITPADRKQLNHFLKKLDRFQEDISACDYTHQKQKYFDLMRSFREYLAGIQDVQLCEHFYHSQEYEKYRDFFVSQNNYYMRALEAIEAVTIMTKQVGGNSAFLDLMDRDYIRERYVKKSKEVKSLDFSKAKHVVVRCLRQSSICLRIPMSRRLLALITIKKRSISLEKW